VYRNVAMVGASPIAMTAPELLCPAAAFAIGNVDPIEAMMRSERFVLLLGGRMMRGPSSTQALLVHPDGVQVCIDIAPCGLDGPMGAVGWRRSAGDCMLFELAWFQFSKYLTDGAPPVFARGDLVPVLPKRVPRGNPLDVDAFSLGSAVGECELGAVDVAASL